MGHPGHVQSRRRVAVCGRRPTEQATQTDTRSQGQRNHDALKGQLAVLLAPVRRCHVCQHPVRLSPRAQAIARRSRKI
jgi:hypothetical protein